MMVNREARILVPVDGSVGSCKAARYAVRLAEHELASLTFLHVMDPNLAKAFARSAESGLDVQALQQEFADQVFNVIRDAINDAPVPCEYELVQGDAASEIVSQAKRRANQIVMGTRGRSEMLNLLMGSVSHKVLQHAHCPVTVVR